MPCEVPQQSRRCKPAVLPPVPARRFTPAALLWVLLCPLVLASQDTQTIVGPSTPTGRYKHPAAITQLDNGDLFLAYYGGDGEYEPGTAVYGMRRDGSGWSKPAALAQDPFYSVGNPVVWQAPDGLVWLFYVVRPGDTWSTSRIAAKVSGDGARTWSDSTVISWEEGMMVRSRPLALRDGAYLLPIYRETGHDTEKVGADTASLFLRFDRETKQWSRSNLVFSRIGNLQPAAVELDDGTLLAYCRRGGDYDPGDDGYVVRTESTDGGRTWSSGVETEFPNPNAAVDLLRLQSGALLLVYNHSMTERTPLATAISDDNGRTFRRGPNIAEGDADFAYPYALQADDGAIHVVYTTAGRTVIKMATFEEQWLQ